MMNKQSIQSLKQWQQKIEIFAYIWLLIFLE